MKFIIPRSTSPSPERVFVAPEQKTRSGYGLRDADLYDLDDDESDDESPSPFEPESDSASDNEYRPNPYNLPRTTAEQRELNLAVAALKRQAKYVDPFREWHKEAQEEAQREGETRHRQLLARIESERLKRLEQEKKRRAAAQQKQVEEMRMMLMNVRLERERELETLRRDFQLRDRKLWDEIDRVIADEDRKAAEKKMEEERRRREEQERIEREERLRQEAEEKRLQEEKERKIREELQRQKEAKEAQEKKERDEADARAAEEKKKQMEGLGQLGVQPPEDEWNAGRAMLARIKTGIHPQIKANRELKTMRNALRRQIVPKIGQLTPDPQHIERVTQSLLDIMKPANPHPQIIYEGLLSALAKAFLRQAETEITAREATALPLAKVLVALLGELPGLGEFLFARLVQRIGFWAIPFVAPMPATMSKEEKDRVKGMQDDDVDGEKRANRIGGVMVLIFCVMHTPHHKPMPEMFRLGRYWTYIARLLSSKTLCKSNIALAILRGALAVAGDQAIRVWGKQWLKVLSIILKRVDDAAPVAILIGTQTIEGTAHRIRVREEIRKLT